MPMAQDGRAKLAEEIGELGQVLGKLAAFPTGDHPDGGPPLRQRLEDEAADVMAAIHFVCETHGLDVGAMTERMIMKLERFRGWHADPAS